MEEYTNKKILKYLALGLSAATAGILIKEIFLDTGAPLTLPPITLSVPEIKIDFSLLKNPLLEAMFTFKEITLPEGLVGRENPFAPY